MARELEWARLPLFALLPLDEVDFRCSSSKSWERSQRSLVFPLIFWRWRLLWYDSSSWKNVVELIKIIPLLILLISNILCWGKGRVHPLYGGTLLVCFWLHHEKLTSDCLKSSESKQLSPFPPFFAPNRGRLLPSSEKKEKANLGQVRKMIFLELYPLQNVFSLLRLFAVLFAQKRVWLFELQENTQSNNQARLFFTFRCLPGFSFSPKAGWIPFFRSRAFAFNAFSQGVSPVAFGGGGRFNPTCAEKWVEGGL